MKIKKVLFSTFTALALVGSIGVNAFAAEATPTVNQGPIEINGSNISGQTISNYANLPYIQTKPIYSKAIGKNIGYASLSYSKKTSIDGRPQFDIVQFEISSLTGSYRAGYQSITTTADAIVVRVDYNNLGLDVGYDIITFTP